MTIKLGPKCSEKILKKANFLYIRCPQCYFSEVELVTLTGKLCFDYLYVGIYD